MHSVTSYHTTSLGLPVMGGGAYPLFSVEMIGAWSDGGYSVGITTAWKPSAECTGNSLRQHLQAPYCREHDEVHQGRNYNYTSSAMVSFKPLPTEFASMRGRIRSILGGISLN